MEYICSKCNTVMQESNLDSYGPFRIYKKTDKKGLLGPKTSEMSDINIFVCSSCGYIEFYAKNPEKFK